MMSAADAAANSVVVSSQSASVIVTEPAAQSSSQADVNDPDHSFVSLGTKGRPRVAPYNADKVVQESTRQMDSMKKARVKKPQEFRRNLHSRRLPLEQLKGQLDGEGRQNSSIA